MNTLLATGGSFFLFPGTFLSTRFSPATSLSWRPSEAVETDACFVADFSCEKMGLVVTQQ